MYLRACIRYALAPERPYPQGLDQVVRVYRALDAKRLRTDDEPSAARGDGGGGGGRSGGVNWGGCLRRGAGSGGDDSDDDMDYELYRDDDEATGEATDEEEEEEEEDLGWLPPVRRLAVVGESAGGNLAAALVVRLLAAQDRAALNASASASGGGGGSGYGAGFRPSSDRPLASSSASTLRSQSSFEGLPAHSAQRVEKTRPPRRVVTRRHQHPGTAAASAAGPCFTGSGIESPVLVPTVVEVGGEGTMLLDGGGGGCSNDDEKDDDFGHGFADEDSEEEAPPTTASTPTPAPISPLPPLPPLPPPGCPRLPDGVVLCYPALNLSLAPSPSHALHAFDPVMPLGIMYAVMRLYPGKSRSRVSRAIPVHPHSPVFGAAASPSTSLLNGGGGGGGGGGGSANAGRMSPHDDPCLSPSHCPDGFLARFPPTHIMAGGFDPLLDDAVDFHTKLRRLGVVASLHVEPNLPHGFLGLCHASASARRAVDGATAFLAEAAFQLRQPGAQPEKGAGAQHRK